MTPDACPLRDQSPNIWAGRKTRYYKPSTGYGTLPDFAGLESIIVWYADCVRGQTGAGFKHPANKSLHIGIQSGKGYSRGVEELCVAGSRRRSRMR